MNKIKVFKFGGASVKDAASVKNVADIIGMYSEDLMVVISAMGKITNALEKLVSRYFGNEEWQEDFQAIKDYHDLIVSELGLQNDASFLLIYEGLFSQLKNKMQSENSGNYDYEYDQIVSYGELISTTIVSGYLNSTLTENEWLDARKLIRTNNNFREGKVDWELTLALFKSKTGLLFKDETKRNICITQGFIGHTDTGQTTTLGREGSDFTAAIAAWCLDAIDVTIWKDVPGMLNADPKYFNNTERLSKISFREAIELSYYGASVIHPKTIKPLQNKDISLYVKSFIEPKSEGSLIQSDAKYDSLVPSYIFKENQMLLSISPRDFSFIVEENMRDIFDALDKCKIKVNMMQNSAISFSICVDYDKSKIDSLLKNLEEAYQIKYNTDLNLMTVRHYNEAILNQLTTNKEVLLEQRSRHTSRFVLREIVK
jgi:aspartate kinase